MRRILIVLVVALTFILSACSQSVYEVKEGNTLVVGLEAAYAPYNWTTTTETEFTMPIHGQAGAFVDGYDVVIAKKIAEELGLKLVIKAIDWDGLIPALQAGTIDVIIAGMSPTAVRKETVNFSSEYYRASQVMVVRTDSKYANATSISEFSGAEVIAQLGTLQDDLVDQIPGVKRGTALESYNAITNAVTSGVSDAFIAELPVAISITSSNPQLKYIQFDSENGFTVLEEDVVSAVAVRKVDNELLEAINGVLEKLSVESKEAWMTLAVSRANAND
jgi:ABC-type amino acid transport substrate-binding protein